MSHKKKKESGFRTVFINPPTLVKKKNSSADISWQSQTFQQNDIRSLSSFVFLADNMICI